MEYELSVGGRTICFSHEAPVAVNEDLERAIGAHVGPLDPGSVLRSCFHPLEVTADGDVLRLVLPASAVPWSDDDGRDLTYAAVTHTIAELMPSFWCLNSRVSASDDTVFIEPGALDDGRFYVARLDSGWAVHGDSWQGLDGWVTCTAGELLILVPAFNDLLYTPVGTRGAFRDDLLTDVIDASGAVIGTRDAVTGLMSSASLDQAIVTDIALESSLTSLRESLAGLQDMIAGVRDQIADLVRPGDPPVARLVEYVGSPAEVPEIPVLPGDLATRVVRVDPDALQVGHRRVEIVDGRWQLWSVGNDPDQINWQLMPLPEVVAHIPSLLDLAVAGRFRHAEVCFYGSLAVVDEQGEVVRGHQGAVEQSIHQPPGPTDRDDVELVAGGKPVRVRFGPQVRGRIDSLAQVLNWLSPDDVYDGAFFDDGWNRFVFREDEGILRLHTPAYADLTPLNSTLDDVTYGLVVEQFAIRGAALLVESLARPGEATVELMPRPTRWCDPVLATDDEFGYDLARATRTLRGWEIAPVDLSDARTERPGISAQVCAQRAAFPYALFLPPGSTATFEFGHLQAVTFNGAAVPITAEQLRELNDAAFGR